MGEVAKAPSGVLAELLPAIRARRQLSAQQLAAKVRKLGGTLDRAAISKIETGARGVSLDEAVLLAVALDVAPVHLLTPRRDDQQVAVTPTTEVPAIAARRWVRGLDPLPGHDDKGYRTEVPQSEWALQGEQLRAARDEESRLLRRFLVAKARLETLTEESAMSKASGADGLGLHDALLANIYGDPREAARIDAAFDRIAEAKVDYEQAKNYRLGLERLARRAGDGDG